MTVERASAGHITVSRRLQHDGRLRPGCAVPAVPLGLLGDDVIFRAGSRLHRCSLSTVLPGLPASLADRTLARLRRTPEFQWLRRRTDGSLSLGLTTGVKPSGETRVRLVDVVSDSCALGVLAWQGDERRPRWMPAGETGWTVPGREPLAEWVTTPPAGSTARGQRREVSVAVRPDGTVSLVGTASNRQRLEQLKVGDPIRVEVVTEVPGVPTGDGRLSYLAQVYLSEVFVELQIAETAPRLVVGHPRRCEVETKRTTDGRPRVSVCDIGMRQVRVGLPDRLVERSDPAISAGHPRSGDYRGASHTSTVGHLPVVLAADQLTQPHGDLPADFHEVLATWLRTFGDHLFGLRPGTELDLVPALSAVAMLGASGSTNPDCATAAVHGLRQLGLRAAASQHVEPLARFLSPSANGFTVGDPIWERLGPCRGGHTWRPTGWT